MKRRGSAPERMFLPAAAAAVLIMLTVFGCAGSASAATFNKTKAQAVSWARERIGKGCEYDEGYGVQCVGLVKFYTNWLGYKIPPCANDKAGNYATQTFPSAFYNYYTRYSDSQNGKVDPQPGDIFVYAQGAYGASSKYGHVGIIYEVGSNYYKYIDYQSNGRTAIDGCIKYGLRNYSALIRPHFSDAHTHSYSTPVSVSKAPTASADGAWTFKCSCGATTARTIPAVKDAGLRDGKYRIASRLDTNKYVSVAPYQSYSGGNIALYSKGVADQEFILKKQSNGTYLIKYGSFVLDVSKGEFGGNIQLYAPNGTASQDWYIVPAGDGWYRLTARCTYYQMDVAGAKTDNGTNIGTWYHNGNNAQLFRFEFISCTEHSWDTGKITMPPSETAEGTRLYTCSVCGETKTESVVKTGHTYVQDKLIPPTCTEPAYKQYRCTGCGHTYKEKAGDTVTYTDWTEAKQTAGADSVLETKVQYRTVRTKSEWKKTGSGTIDYAESWPAGFDRNSSLYSKYNKTPRTASETDTAKTEVSTSQNGYIYWHWCYGTYQYGPINRKISSTKTSTFPQFHAFYSAEDHGVTTSANARQFPNASVCKDTHWWVVERVSIKRCTYTEYTKDSSQMITIWRDEKPSVPVGAKLETRTLYRLKTTIQGAPKGHAWDTGTVTKQPSVNEEGVRTYKCKVCGVTKTEQIAKLPAEAGPQPEQTAEKKTEQTAKPTAEETPGKSEFALLQLRYTKVTKSSISLSWSKVKKAKKYVLYGSLCGKKYKKIKTLKSTKTVIKKLKAGKYYKYYVRAVSGKKELARSKTVHVVTNGGKYGNFKSVKLTNVKKNRLTLKKGRTFTIKSKAVPAGKKKVSIHRKTAYESSDPKVASVSGKGVIKAKKPGKCYIYVYAQSGTFSRIAVTVKK